jgi:DASH complex subunit Ask1
MMTTRTQTFFNEKVKQIDEKINECFVSLKNDIIPHLKDYRLNDSALKVSSKNIGVLEMCISITKLEQLRDFYLNKLAKVENPLEKIIGEKLQKDDFPEIPKSEPTKN